MMKGKKYPFLIANTGRSDKQGTHWWSILDVDGKKYFLLFDSFGIKGPKNFIAQNNEKILSKILKVLENLKENKEKVNLVKVKFVKNTYNKLSEGEKAALSKTCLEFLHFVESFAEYEKQGIIHLWLFEEPIQDLKLILVAIFRHIFMRLCFFQTVIVFYNLINI